MSHGTDWNALAYGCLVMNSSKGKPTMPKRAIRLLALLTCVMAATLGLTGTSAWALNPNSYTQLKNADLHQLCMDIKSEDPAEGARAQLWNCTGASEQQFIIRGASGPVTGLWTIRSKSAGKCLEVKDTFAGAGVVQHTCLSAWNPSTGGDFTQAENWDLRPTGEIVNELTGMCLDTTSDRKGWPLMIWPCNGGIAQRWFF